MQDLTSYARTQATAAAVINMVVNPLLSWLGNLDRAVTPVASLSVSVAITCLVMATLIAFFLASGTRKALSTGKVRPGPSAGSAVLGHLPRSWFALGVSLGLLSALVLVPLTSALFMLLGLEELPFWAVLVFQVVYTPVLAYLLSVVVIRRVAASRVPALP